MGMLPPALWRAQGGNGLAGGGSRSHSGRAAQDELPSGRAAGICVALAQHIQQLDEDGALLRAAHREAQLLLRREPPPHRVRLRHAHRQVGTGRAAVLGGGGAREDRLRYDLEDVGEGPPGEGRGVVGSSATGGLAHDMT